MGCTELKRGESGHVRGKSWPTVESLIAAGIQRQRPPSVTVDVKTKTSWCASEEGGEGGGEPEKCVSLKRLSL